QCRRDDHCGAERYSRPGDSTDASGGGGTINGSGTPHLTIAGTLAQVNADLSTLTEQENGTNSDSIDVATSDGRGGSDDHKIAVTVTVTNAPPVTTVPGSQVVQQGQPTAISGISVADADAVNAGETITVV